MKSKAMIGVLSLIGFFNVAQAAYFTIDVTTPAPAPITVFVGDFERGFSINGSQVQSGINGYSGTFARPSITFSGSWITPGAFYSVNRTVYFVDSSNQVTSILQYNASANTVNSQISGSFTTGTLGAVPTGTNPSNIWQVGTPFVYQHPFFSGQVLTAVPEPSSLVAGAFGLLMLLRPADVPDRPHLSGGKEHEKGCCLIGGRLLLAIPCQKGHVCRLQSVKA